MVATIAVALALGVGKLVEPLLGLETVDLIFLSAVLGVAVAYGLLPSLFASVLASLAYNFFFLPPIYTFTIADPTNVAAFLFFLVVAVVGSNLAARVRSQMLTAQEPRPHDRGALRLFSESSPASPRSTISSGRRRYQIASMLKLDVVLLLPENGRLELKAAYPPEDTLDEADLGAAKWAFETQQAGGPRRRTR